MDPAPKDLNQKWRDREHSRFSVVKGDFDGDGKVDEARILIAKDRKRFAIFIWLASNEPGKAEEVLSEEDFSLLGEMGITCAKKGSYRTACGKGYFDCSSGEPAKVTLSAEGIDYFKNEGVNSIFRWDKKRKRFVRTWMSD